MIFDPKGLKMLPIEPNGKPFAHFFYPKGWFTFLLEPIISGLAPIRHLPGVDSKQWGRGSGEPVPSAGK
jgi:hypothetical protein